MSLHDYILANAAGATFRADLNLVLLAISSNNSYATAPTTTYSYMWWYDTANSLLKMRNAADDAWITIGTLDQTNDLFTPFISDPKSAYRSHFVFKDIDEIYLDGGNYRHVGTKIQMLEWTSRLTYQFTSLAASTTSYLYLDDSKIVTADTNIITASELVDYTQEPDAYDPVKGGRYHPTNVNDRCIFAVGANASGEILGFDHLGEFVRMHDYVEILVTTDIDTTWVDVVTPAPSFASMIQGYFRMVENGGVNTELMTRPKGAIGGGSYVGISTGSQNYTGVLSLTGIGDDSSFQIKYNDGGSNQASASYNGWFFGEGI